MAQAYKRLSPEFQKRLHGLKAVHSGVEQVNASLNGGGIARRDPVTSEHPIVRTHPVTGEKALYVNPQCEFCSSSRRFQNIVLTQAQSPVPLSDIRRKSRIICSSSFTIILRFRRICRLVFAGRLGRSLFGITG